jgi:uncharacterized protein YjbI with pentapeptide repeats
MEETIEHLAGRAGPVVGRQFRDEDLEDFGLFEMVFIDCRFTDCVFDRARIGSVRFEQCRFLRCSFREAEITDCQFVDQEARSGCDWQDCDFSEARLRRCDLGMNVIARSRAYLASFSDCALPGARIEVEVQRRISKKKVLGGLSFDRCKLQYAQFAPADLEESRFDGSDLRDCVFQGSDLSRASFRGASLNNADFTDATLDGAILAYASFDSFDFAAAASFRGAVISRDQHEAILASMGLLTLD